MKLCIPQEYTLKIASDYSYELKQDDEKCSFSSPATVRGVAKLYTVSQGNELFYVGIAKQPMSSRLNYGFKSDGRAGYHGYKWKNVRGELKLKVWVAKSDNEYVSLNEIEIIEAEVAYLCRHLSSQWPKYSMKYIFTNQKQYIGNWRRLFMRVQRNKMAYKAPHPTACFAGRGWAKSFNVRFYEILM